MIDCRRSVRQHKREKRYGTLLGLETKDDIFMVPRNGKKCWTARKMSNRKAYLIDPALAIGLNALAEVILPAHPSRH